MKCRALKELSNGIKQVKIPLIQKVVSNFWKSAKKFGSDRILCCQLKKSHKIVN